MQIPSGQWIKSLRKSLGLNQQEFANQFGLAVGALENWEQERRTPDQAAVVLLHLINQEPETMKRLVLQMRRAQ